MDKILTLRPVRFNVCCLPVDWIAVCGVSGRESCVCVVNMRCKNTTAFEKKFFKSLS